MELISALILMPCFAALVMLFIRQDKARAVLSASFAAIIAALSVAFAAVYLPQGSVSVELPASYASALGGIGFVLDLVVGAFILAYAVRYKRTLAAALVLVQIVGAIAIEAALSDGVEFSTAMHIDALAVVMVLIIGVIGSGICVYSLGYMKDFQDIHADQKDRRPWFFAVIFAFLSAMYNVVLVDNLSWMYTAWEITTLCSFLLIGFTKTEEAIDNAFRQIVMNMLGGIAFQAAIAYLCIEGLPLTMSAFLAQGAQGSALFALPVALLAFAGMTKAAQMPFHTWLLGAMVAPTPTSALLHSSTMVKAGVFLLIKLAPLFLVYPTASAMVIAVGGFTFLMSSLLAISQSNAKRVLAYSTIGNLGLIAACAGVGTPEAVWAAIFLIIFHAAAKSLLFLCVGSAEHQIGSRDIESMDGLFDRMPRLARYMMLGCMGMFIAPFGMLISKWASLVSFASTGQVLLLGMLAFGSAATFMFWAKFIGKLSGVAAHAENQEMKIHRSEWATIGLMAVLTVGCAVFMPLLSAGFVEQYLASTYAMAGDVIGADNMLITSVSSAFIVAVMFGALGHARKRIVPIYLGGVTIDKSARTFRDSMSKPRQATARNWYLEDIFGERILDKPATVISAIAVVVGLAASAAFSVASFETAIALPMYASVGTVGDDLLRTLIGTVAFAVLGPVVGCLLAGADRIVTARMQGRVGPPLLQPYYDVRKLLMKDDVAVNSVEDVYVTCALIFALLSGGAFFGGGNFLMCAFLITLSALFFILAAYSTRSPYAEIGADRETVQVMAYEPVILFMAVCMFLAIGTFDVAGVALYSRPLIVVCIPVFLALMFVLTIKLRKSPFDLSYSHHGHQEIVKGITTEMSGRTLAKVEVMHWCESVLFLGWVGMFFVWGNPVSYVLAVAVALAAWLLEIFIDNNFARVKWQAMLKWAWIVGGVLGIGNIAALCAFIVF